MKPMNQKPHGFDQGQKWGLFILLAGSLGFTLSMNPDHFNNIARNEYGMSGVFELAQQATPAPSKPPTVADAKAAKAAAAKPAEKPATKATELTDAEKKAAAEKTARETLHAKLRDGLKQKGVDAAKIEIVMKRVNEYQTKGLKPGVGFMDGLVAAGYTSDEAREIIQDLADDLGQTTAKNTPEKSEAEKAPAKEANNSEKNGMTIDDPRMVALIKKVMAEEAKNKVLLNTNNQVQSVAGGAKPQPTAASSANSEVAANNGSTTPAVQQQQASPPGQTPGQPFTIFLNNDESNCVVSIELQDGKTIGKAKRAEGQVCHLESEKPLKIDAAFNDVNAINKIVNELFKNGKEKSEKSKSEIAEELWEKADKVCENKEGLRQIECQKKSLVEISKKMDKSRESREALRDLFDSNLSPTLQAMFTNATTNPETGEIDTTDLENADGISRELLNKLSRKNGGGVVSSLAKLKGKSYMAQVDHARELYINSQMDKRSPDFATQWRGFRNERYALRALNGSSLSAQLGNDYGLWSAGSAVDPEAKRDLDRYFRQPIQSMIKRLPTLMDYRMFGSNQQTLAMEKLQNWSLLGGDDANLPVTPGIVSLETMPQALRAERIQKQTQYRGYNTQPITVGGALSQQNMNNRLLNNGQQQVLPYNQQQVLPYNQQQTISGSRRGASRMTGFESSDLYNPFPY